MKKQNLWKRIAFGAYCALMLYLLFFQRSPWPVEDSYAATMLRNLNLVPGDTIFRFLRVWNDPMYHRAAIVNVLGNIVMFIPLGFGLPWVHPGLRRLWKTLLCAAGIIILVEATQLVTLLGHCDVDDLILNLLGVLPGYGLWRLLEKL